MNLKLVYPFFTSIFILLHTFEISSQSLSVQLGVNFSSAIVKVDKNSIIDASSIKPKRGVVFGALIDLPVEDRLSISLSPSFISKGFTIESETTILNQNVSVEATLNLNYIELPIIANYTISNGEIKFIGLLGGYVSMGVGGKGVSKLNAGSRSSVDTRPVSWGAEDGDLKRIDTGLIGGIKVERSKYWISGLYSLGIPNVFANRAEDQVFKNSVISMILGYKLASLKSK